jgi:hypothetical protein
MIPDVGDHPTKDDIGHNVRASTKLGKRPHEIRSHNLVREENVLWSSQGVVELCRDTC